MIDEKAPEDEIIRMEIHFEKGTFTTGDSGILGLQISRVKLLMLTDRKMYRQRKATIDFLIT